MMRKLYFTILVVLPIFLSAQPVNQILSSANAAEKSRNYLQAESLYLQALAQAPNRSDAQNRLINLYINTFQYDKAAQLLRQSNGETNPSNQLEIWKETEYWKAQSFLEDLPISTPKVPAFSMETYPTQDDQRNLDLIKANPNHFEALFAIGLTLYNYKNSEAPAEQYLLKAISVQPNHLEARRVLGQLLQRLGRFGEAEVHFQKMVALTPNNIEGFLELESLYNQWKRLGKLEDTYKNILIIDRQHLPSLEKLSRLFEQQGRFVEAERLCKEYLYSQKDYQQGVRLLEGHYIRSLQAQPNSAQLHQDVANLYYQMLFEWHTVPALYLAKDFPLQQEALIPYLAQQSVTHFEKALELQPNLPDKTYIQFQLGKLYTYLKQAEKSVAPLEQAASMMQNKTDAQFLLIDAYLNTNQTSKALSLLENLASKGFLDYENEKKLAYLYALSGKQQEAIDLADKIIEYYPNRRTAESYRIKALALRLSGKIDESLVALRQSIRVDFDNSDAHYSIAKHYFRNSNRNEGIVWLESALFKDKTGKIRLIAERDNELNALKTWELYQNILAQYPQE
ncbi:MAG: tetratricopeptide repeat protein [Saprospiraceae bacterium]|nr:tetratricopeptide repeat protein [Saprospiraceae bacterium]